MSKILGPRVHQPVTSPELATRIKRLSSRGLPNIDVEQMVKLVYNLNTQPDAGSDDVPRFFTAQNTQPAVAAQNSTIGLEGRAARTVIDMIIVQAGAASAFTIATNALPPIGGVSARRNAAREVNGVAAARCVATINNRTIVGTVGEIVGRGGCAAIVSTILPFQWRLSRPSPTLVEELNVTLTVVNTLLDVTFIGREWDE